MGESHAIRTELPHWVHTIRCCVPVNMMNPLAMMAGMGMGMPQPGAELPQPDTAETVQISSFCLLKMLRHGEQAIFVQLAR